MASDGFSVLFSLLRGGFFFLVFGGLGLWLVIASRKQQQKVAASQNWPSVSAQITLAEVRESVSRDEEGNLQRSYYPHVE